MEEAVNIQGDLEEIKQLLLNLKAWQNWLKEMRGPYKSNQLLQPQGNFYEIFMEMQLILSKNITAKPQRF